MSNLPSDPSGVHEWLTEQFVSPNVWNYNQYLTNSDITNNLSEDWLKLLETFTFGSYADLSSIPNINIDNSAIEKLRQLSILRTIKNYVTQTKNFDIPYSNLLESINSNDEYLLESLIKETLFADKLIAKFDNETKTLNVVKLIYVPDIKLPGQRTQFTNIDGVEEVLAKLMSFKDQNLGLVSKEVLKVHGEVISSKKSKSSVATPEQKKVQEVRRSSKKRKQVEE